MKKAWPSFVLTSLILTFFISAEKSFGQLVNLEAGKLRISVVDNKAYGDHRAGYNGISELRHEAQDSSIFITLYAGFNLEHIYGGDSLTDKFEPRRNPMNMQQISATEAILHQPETPLSHVESWTHFKLAAPHYIDVTFKFIIHNKDFFRHGYAGLFWASYIDSPEDIRIHFKGVKKGEEKADWISAYSPSHGELSTHVCVKDAFDMFAAPNFEVTLASNYSNYRFDQHFYYGRFHNMVFAYLFKQPEEGLIRFSQSPTGAGPTNPAWDFQYLIPDFQVGKAYSFKVRLVYKEWLGRDDILQEFNNWIEN